MNDRGMNKLNGGACQFGVPVAKILLDFRPEAPQGMMKSRTTLIAKDSLAWCGSVGAAIGLDHVRRHHSR